MLAKGNTRVAARRSQRFGLWPALLWCSCGIGFKLVLFSFFFCHLWLGWSVDWFCPRFPVRRECVLLAVYVPYCNTYISGSFQFFLRGFGWGLWAFWTLTQRPMQYDNTVPKPLTSVFASAKVI